MSTISKFGVSTGDLRTKFGVPTSYFRNKILCLPTFSISNFVSVSYLHKFCVSPICIRTNFTAQQMPLYQTFYAYQLFSYCIGNRVYYLSSYHIRCLPRIFVTYLCLLCISFPNLVFTIYYFTKFVVYQPSPYQILCHKLRLILKFGVTYNSNFGIDFFRKLLLVD